MHASTTLRAAVQPGSVAALSSRAHRSRRAARTPVTATTERSSASVTLVDRCKSLTAELNKYGVDLPRIRMVVLGPTYDVRAVALFSEALQGVAPPGADERKLEKAVEALQALLDEKVDETAEYADARRRQDAVSSNLTANEQLQMNRMMTGAFSMGTQGAIWSSMVMLVLGLGVLTLLRGQ